MLRSNAGPVDLYKWDGENWQRCDSCEKELKPRNNKSTDLQIAAQPLIDYLYKYGCPHSYVLVTQTSAELMSGECSAVFEPRD